MSLLYFGRAVFCLFGAIESQNLTQCSVSSVQCTYVQCMYVHSCWGEGLRVKFWDSSPKLAEYTSPKYNDDISLLISQYLISAPRNLNELFTQDKDIFLISSYMYKCVIEEWLTN
jgi:hypothetical protein